jgi:DNA invertase Pin-like site-specific DNA recombinase
MALPLYLRVSSHHQITGKMPFSQIQIAIESAAKNIHRGPKKAPSLHSFVSDVTTAKVVTPIMM